MNYALALITLVAYSTGMYLLHRWFVRRVRAEREAMKERITEEMNAKVSALSERVDHLGWKMAWAAMLSGRCCYCSGSGIDMVATGPQVYRFLDWMEHGGPEPVLRYTTKACEVCSGTGNQEKSQQERLVRIYTKMRDEGRLECPIVATANISDS